MVKLTVAGTVPSNDPEVHKAGCADIARGLKRGKYASYSLWDIEVEKIEDAAIEYWSDIIAEGSMTEDDAISYTKFLPCTGRA